MFFVSNKKAQNILNNQFILSMHSRINKLLSANASDPSYSFFPESNIQNDRHENHDFMSAIGIIRVNWRNSKGELISINYGTAFAVNPKIIATCTHNIFSELVKDLCTEILFIPGKRNGRIEDGDRVYKCSIRNQIKYQTPKQSMKVAPLQKQLTLFMLDDGQELNCPYYLKIGTIYQEIHHKELFIAGYPSQKFYTKTNLFEVIVDRVQIRGRLHSIDRHIINHTMQTSVGHSGSPIIAKDNHGVYYAVGIHTHKGLKPQFNSGLYFNRQVMEKAAEFERQLFSRFYYKRPSIFHAEKIQKYRILNPDEWNALQQSYIFEIISIEETQQIFKIGHPDSENSYNLKMIEDQIQQVEDNSLDEEENSDIIFSKEQLMIKYEDGEDQQSQESQQSFEKQTVNDDMSAIQIPPYSNQKRPIQQSLFQLNKKVLNQTSDSYYSHIDQDKSNPYQRAKQTFSLNMHGNCQ